MLVKGERKVYINNKFKNKVEYLFKTLLISLFKGIGIIFTLLIVYNFSGYKDYIKKLNKIFLENTLFIKDFFIDIYRVLYRTLEDIINIIPFHSLYVHYFIIIIFIIMIISVFLKILVNIYEIFILNRIRYKYIINLRLLQDIQKKISDNTLFIYKEKAYSYTNEKEVRAKLSNNLMNYIERSPKLIDLNRLDFEGSYELLRLIENLDLILKDQRTILFAKCTYLVFGPEDDFNLKINKKE